jgi:hypothetical protein
MTTRATQQKVGENIRVGNLFLSLPDTDFREFLDETEELARIYPEIILAIDKDLDGVALRKKRLRQSDKRFFANQTTTLPFLDIDENNSPVTEMKLGVGRPRLPAYIVYIFMMTRGFLGSLSTSPASRFLSESISLYGFLQNHGLNMPGESTIIENVNAISPETRALIFNRQIAVILGEKLDDFKSLTLDSTAVKANSSWPTDAKILTGLLQRVNRLGQELHLFGLKDFSLGRVPRWLEEMDKLDFRICLVAGKAKSKGKMKNHYRQLLKRGKKAADVLTAELNTLEQTLSLQKQAPSRQVLLERVLQQIKGDLFDANRVLEYAYDRVFHGKVLPSKEKVLSLSDGSAAFIQKGGRNAVIGYKPQLVRSANGFVTNLIVPQGNTADSDELVPAIADSILRTGVVPDLVSTDDGYASAKGRDEVLGMGVKDISISGAKGKKLTDPDKWSSELYRTARGDRSAVESLMFTIKNGFEFGELGRRGLKAVRDELLEKVLAYNCCRISLMKKRRREELAVAA